MVIRRDPSSRFDTRGVKCRLVRDPVGSLADYLALLSPFLRLPGSYWFRGHASKDWRLVPSALRFSTLRERERALALLVEFKRVAEIKLPASRVPAVDEELRWLQVAQHFGVPTRLLDWTANPLVGLYFACCELPDEDALQVGSRYRGADLLAFLGPTVSRERPLVALLIDLARQTLPA